MTHLPWRVWELTGLESGRIAILGDRRKAARHSRYQRIATLFHTTCEGCEKHGTKSAAGRANNIGYSYDNSDFI